MSNHRLMLQTNVYTLIYLPLCVSLYILGCAPTNQNVTELPLLVSGTDNSQSLVTKNGTQITLDRVELAFGPLYLCAGVTAGELCEVSRLEWLDSVVINALDGTAQSVGNLSGVTGTVRSWMYDLGISSQLTRNEPFVLDAAKELGGASIVIEGRAQIDEIELPFSAAIAIQQTDDTELGVPVVRKSLSDDFLQEVTLNEGSLTIRFDPTYWVNELDFNAYVGRDTCTTDGPNIACDGTQEYLCDGQMVISQQNCNDFGQVCLPKQGCADLLNIMPESQQYRAIRNALLSGVRPTFIWSN